MESIRYRSRVLIIGSGLAGCTAALVLANQGHEVSLLTPADELDGGNSTMAQGGIVFVKDKEEARALESDMYVAGHRYNFGKAVRFLATQGGEAVQRILVEQLRVPFNHRSADSSDWDLTLEGGHSAPRILHCADYTGRAIMEALHAAIAANPRVRVLNHRSAVDLITTEHHAAAPAYRYQLRNQCVGAYVFNDLTSQVEPHLADYTVLATGGVGQVYLHSTNSPWAIGAGISMAQRAGVRVANMEFVQFHPTALYRGDQQRSLITEAMRGEGARLINARGEAFMKRYDGRGDLAPRDVVSQAIVSEMLSSGDTNVFLDATHMDCDVTERFPTILENCLKIGIDIRTEPIPVVPAAHYFCGGILVDLRGRTTLDRLYAVGECSCTGIHGANRLASTSLLEALLWGASAGEDIATMLSGKDRISPRVLESIPDWESPGDEHNDDPALVAQDWTTIRNIMWNYVGIMRTESRLRRAFADLRDLSSHLHDFYRRTPLSQPLVRLFHGCQTAYLITQAALRNKRSLGCHHRED
ncbi:MAG TPA: L-aspartate oxidase [Candidatus Mailhella merdigallinarum]|uniref:L-aspartate oxidase n=1 Tax=Candidatus Mailhella merdigallinarum TaxID=2838658 RepID=A0A9D2HDB5_9BACT|nr:L-aspartate oxidase [Candidatus Mailhella merdigallinarum]